MEEKDLQKKLDELKDSLEKAATDKAKKEIADQIAAFETKHKEAIEGYTELKKNYDELKVKADKLAADAEANQPVIDAFVANKDKKQAPTTGETFNDILGATIKKNAELFRNMKKGGNDFGIPLEMKGVDPKNPKEVKTVGDMSISANFTGSSNFVQDVRTQLIATPYNRVWIADLLPQGSSNGNPVIYPKENGGEGGAALWTDYTADKAQMDFDLTSQSAYFKWIAGWVIVAREMLDDISWMTSYIQQKMLVSLKTAENAFVLNGSADSNPVDGLLDVATAYNGAFTTDVDQLIDAAYGQIVEDTNEFYTGNLAIMRPREAVRIGLNKSGGSIEYDLPAGSVGFVNGQLSIGGLRVATTTAIADGTALVLDTSATSFLRRLQPELRVFEDSTLAKKNKIMFRIEERATLIIFNNDAIVNVPVETSAS